MSQSQRHVDGLGQKSVSFGMSWPVLAFTNERGQRASGHQGKGILVDQATECWSGRTCCTNTAKYFWIFLELLKYSVNVWQNHAKSQESVAVTGNHWGPCHFGRLLWQDNNS